MPIVVDPDLVNITDARNTLRVFPYAALPRIGHLFSGVAGAGGGGPITEPVDAVLASAELTSSADGGYHLQYS